MLFLFPQYKGRFEALILCLEKQFISQVAPNKQADNF